MAQKATMLKKTTWLLSGRIIADGLSFVFYLALARTFGKVGIGNYSFAFAVAALFGLVVQFGLRNLVTREFCFQAGILLSCLRNRRLGRGALQQLQLGMKEEQPNTWTLEICM